IDNDIFARLLFQFGEFFHHISSDDGGFFPGSSFERGRDDIFFHAVEDWPRTIAGRLCGPARPKHFIGGPSQQVHIAFRVLLHNVLYSLGAIIRMPPVTHRICIKDSIEGHPRLHPELSHSCSPSPACRNNICIPVASKNTLPPCKEKNFFYLAGSKHEEWSDLRATSDQSA